MAYQFKDADDKELTEKDWLHLIDKLDKAEYNEATQEICIDATEREKRALLKTVALAEACVDIYSLPSRDELDRLRPDRWDKSDDVTKRSKDEAFSGWNDKQFAYLTKRPSP
jgi:hypothetical protein